MTINELASLFTQTPGLQDTPIFFTTGLNGRQTVNNNFDPALLAQYWLASKIALGVYEKIQNAVAVDQFCFVPKVPTASQSVADKMTDILNENVDVQNIIDKIINGFWGTGGDVLVYEKKGKFYAYNFMENGKNKIAWYYDVNTNDIVKYDILSSYNNTEIVDEVLAKDTVHLRYANPFNTHTGITPALMMYDYWRFKSQIMYANETIYLNGLQASKLITVKNLNGLENPEAYAKLIESISKLKEELKAGTGLLNRNKSLVTAVPNLEVHDLQLNNVNMETMRVLDWIDEQTYLASGIPQELFKPEKNKYSDSEILRDEVRLYIDRKFKCLTESVVSNFILPRLLPNFKYNKYKYSYLKTVTNEDLAIQEQSVEKIKVLLDFYNQAKTNGLNVTFSEEKKTDLLKFGLIIQDDKPVENQPIETENKPVNNQSTNPTPNEEQQIKDTIENETLENSKNHIEIVKDTRQNLKKAKDIVKNALVKQLKDLHV